VCASAPPTQCMIETLDMWATFDGLPEPRSLFCRVNRDRGFWYGPSEKNRSSDAGGSVICPRDESPETGRKRGQRPGESEIILTDNNVATIKSAMDDEERQWK
jgi:hypothetical protein